MCILLVFLLPLKHILKSAEFVLIHSELDFYFKKCLDLGASLAQDKVKQSSNQLLDMPVQITCI